MLKKALFALKFAIILLTFCSCRDKPPEKQGANNSADSPRIVSLAPNLTEILFRLDLGTNIVGTTRYSNYPPQAQNINRVGTFWQPNIEAIIAARPDLVITLAFSQQKQLSDKLAQLGCRCLMVDIESIDQLFSAIDQIGRFTSVQEKAGQLASSIRAKMASYTVENPEKRPKVLWVIQRQPLRVAGEKTFINDLIFMAGGRNAIGQTLQLYPPVGTEQLLDCRAEIIIEPLSDAADIQKKQQQAIEYWSRYDNLPAVQKKRIYVINGDVVSRLGPRLPEGLKMIAECIKGH